MIKNRFDNIKAAIINNRKNINLDLVNKSRKNIYKKILKKNNNSDKNLNNNIIDKLIYIFFWIRYIKTKTNKKYIYIN